MPEALRLSPRCIVLEDVADGDPRMYRFLQHVYYLPGVSLIVTGKSRGHIGLLAPALFTADTRLTGSLPRGRCGRPGRCRALRRRILYRRNSFRRLCSRGLHHRFLYPDIPGCSFPGQSRLFIRPLQTPPLLRGSDDPLHALGTDPALCRRRGWRGWRRNLTFDPEAHRNFCASAIFLRAAALTLNLLRLGVGPASVAAEPAGATVTGASTSRSAASARSMAAFCHSLILPVGFVS